MKRKTDCRGWMKRRVFETENHLKAQTFPKHFERWTAKPLSRFEQDRRKEAKWGHLNDVMVSSGVCWRFGYLKRSVIHRATPISHAKACRFSASWLSSLLPEVEWSKGWFDFNFLFLCHRLHKRMMTQLKKMTGERFHVDFLSQNSWLA